MSPRRTAVLLECYTGLAVATIGVALFPILKPHGKRLAAGYLVLRAAECVAIVAIGVYFVTSRSPFADYPLVVWLSVPGVVGYAALLTGAVGYARTDAVLEGVAR